MGFYSYFYDNEEQEHTDFSRKFSEKWAYGHELFQWCFRNGVQYTEDYLFPCFVLDKDDVRKAIQDKVMDRANTKYLLKPMLKHMEKEGLDYVYFVGDF